jgi:hypothetical protein
MMHKNRGYGFTTWAIAAIFFVGLFSFQGEVEADSRDWMEQVICDTDSAVTSVAIGDADNDGINEFVVGQWSPTQQVIAFEKSGVTWVDDVIVSAPAIIYSVAIGDCDNDGKNEVVIGMVSTTNEVRAYEFQGGFWVEDLIADTPNNVYSVAIGDADNDGNNEVVIGLHSSSSEVRAYEKSAGIWVEDVIADAPTHVRSVAIADCDNDGKEEVVIGMDLTANEVRAYEKSGGIWVEDIIANTPNNVYSISVGDCDNDGHNEVVIGMYSSSDEVRAYEKSGGIWVEDVVADTPESVYSTAIGDCDNDGNNEVLIGMVSTQDEVRVYEKDDFGWKEDIVSDTSMDVFACAVGDADSDGENEVAIGMWSTTGEARIYDYDEGQIAFTSHENGDYVKGIVCLEVAAASSVEEIRFYLNDEFTHVDANYPYQYIMDTNELIEDAVYTVKAECIRCHTPPQSTSIDITVNNAVQSGDFITVGTLSASYEPDQMISVLVGMNSPPDSDSLNLEVSYADQNQNTYYAVNETLPYASQLLVGLPIFSDANLGTYTITVTAYGYDGDEFIWYSTKAGSFDVAGKSVHERLDDLEISVSDINSTLCQLQSDIAGMNQQELLGKLEHLNQTVHTKIDEVLVELLEVNESILLQLSAAEAELLAAIYDINSSLSLQFSDLIATTDTFYNSIQEDIEGVYNSLTLLEANLSAQHDGISDAIATLNDAVTQSGDLLDGINDTILLISNLDQKLSIHDAEISAVLDTLIDLVEQANDLTEDELLTNITAVIDSLTLLDASITSHDSEVKDDLASISIILSNFGSLDLLELSGLVQNLSINDASISDKMVQLEQSIDEFKDEVDGKLANISDSLDELANLNELIENMGGSDDTSQSSQNLGSGNDEESSLSFTVILIGFGFVLAIVFLALMHLFRENRMLKETLGIGSKDITYVEEER